MPYSTHRIGRAFGRAIAYQDHAAVQKETASRLAQIAANHQNKTPRRVLELGCGTGLLTEQLQLLWPQAEMFVTDLSPEMVTRCHKAHRRPSTMFAAMDAQKPACCGPFDVIISSLALHWTADLQQTGFTLLDLLAPDGLLALSLPGSETFHQWRTILRGYDRSPGFAPFFSGHDMTSFWGEHVTSIEENTINIVYPSGRDFLHALKGLGAATPHPGYTPLPPKMLIQALDKLSDTPGKAGATLTWHILYATLQKHRDSF